MAKYRAANGCVEHPIGEMGVRDIASHDPRLVKGNEFAGLRARFLVDLEPKEKTI